MCSRERSQTTAFITPNIDYSLSLYYVLGTFYTFGYYYL